MNINIYVVGGALNYASFIKDANIVDKLEDANVVLFTGGEDVDPSLYGCEKHPYTSSNIKRDKAEKAIFSKVKPNQLCLGICRGSQFLCVMNGGILVQNCSGHAMWGTHPITNGRTVYEITSTHHQMQYPFLLKDTDYEVLFKATNIGEDYSGDKINPEVLYNNGDPEIVLYHKKDLPVCLAIQGHPEMMPDSPVSAAINKMIQKLLEI